MVGPCFLSYYTFSTTNIILAVTHIPGYGKQNWQWILSAGEVLILSLLLLKNY